MSGIAGIINFNQQPADPAILRRATYCAAYRGPDGGGLWVDGPVVLSQLLPAATAEAVDEKKPMRDEGADLCIVFNGRIDNREEFTAALSSRGVRRTGETEMEIALRSYQCRGHGCANRIVGDCAFVVRDGKRK